MCQREKKKKECVAECSGSLVPPFPRPPGHLPIDSEGCCTNVTVLWVSILGEQTVYS